MATSNTHNSQKKKATSRIRNLFQHKALSKKDLLNISMSILKRWSGRLAPRPFSGNTFPREEMILWSNTSYFLGNFLIKTKIATFKMANLF